MPKLLTYIPCEKVVIDSLTNNVSITSMISEIEIKIPHGVPLPSKGTFVPMPWNILSVWEWGEQDTNKTFEAKSVLIAQSGEELLETSITKFKREPHKNFQRNIDQITGFPIWVPGRAELRLMFRIEGSGEFSQQASFPIVVVHGSVH